MAVISIGASPSYRIFALPLQVFGGVNGLLRRLEKAGEKFRFIWVRHEKMAAFMASADGKFSLKRACASPPAALAKQLSCACMTSQKRG